jgi:hypothetical protein
MAVLAAPLYDGWTGRRRGQRRLTTSNPSGIFAALYSSNSRGVSLGNMAWFVAGQEHHYVSRRGENASSRRSRKGKDTAIGGRHCTGAAIAGPGAAFGGPASRRRQSSLAVHFGHGNVILGHSARQGSVMEHDEGRHSGCMHGIRAATGRSWLFGVVLLTEISPYLRSRPAIRDLPKGRCPYPCRRPRC